MAKRAEAEELVAFAKKQFGKVDILVRLCPRWVVQPRLPRSRHTALPLPPRPPRPQVNNAGIQHVSPVESFPADKWDDVLAINLSSCFHLIRGTVGGAYAIRGGARWRGQAGSTWKAVV